MTETTLLTALALGVAYAAIPGAVNTEALRRGVSSGFASAALIQIGALLGDALWAAVALSGTIVLLQFDLVGFALGVVGAGFLFHLARTALTSAIRGAPEAGESPRAGGSLVTGVVFSLANPAGLAFWSGIGGGILSVGNTDVRPADAAVFLAAFILGASVWGIGMAALVSWGRRFATPRVFRAIDALCGLALSYFAIRLLWSTFLRYGRWLTLSVRGIG